MEFIALVSFLLLVVGWVLAPNGAVQAEAGRSEPAGAVTPSVAD